MDDIIITAYELEKDIFTCKNINRFIIHSFKIFISIVKIKQTSVNSKKLFK